MRIILILALLGLIAVPAFASFHSDLQWIAFKQTYGRSYATVAEESHRFSVFLANNNRAARLSAANPKATFGVTKFSDLTPAEFKAQYLNLQKPAEFNVDEAPVAEAVEYDANAAPPTFDWRSKGVISPVKDQGQCGSCWAFSATETAESFWALQKKTLPILAPQQIVSCDNATGDQGCNGGWPAWSYGYLKTTGLESEDSYPYTSGTSGATGTCGSDSTKVVTTPLTTFNYVITPCNDTCAAQDELTMAHNVATTGPASVCVVANIWQTYTGGVVTSGCDKAYDEIDHCVQAVAIQTDTTYGTYWVVRNSWNSNWGMDGFIYLQFGSNQCGLADQATFVTY